MLKWLILLSNSIKSLLLVVSPLGLNVSRWKRSYFPSDGFLFCWHKITYTMKCSKGYGESETWRDELTFKTKLLYVIIFKHVVSGSLCLKWLSKQRILLANSGFNFGFGHKHTRGKDPSHSTQSTCKPVPVFNVTTTESNWINASQC